MKNRHLDGSIKASAVKCEMYLNADVSFNLRTLEHGELLMSLKNTVGL